MIHCATSLIFMSKMIIKSYREGKSNYLMMYKNIPTDISESTVHKAVCIKPLDGTNSPVSGVLLICMRVIS